ncbi:hypothetical protein DK37_21610 [Halomonas sp. SUBG004]|nr:hypothetical protein DK37_21610 [Halomonas sp. SUBG004]
MKRLPGPSGQLILREYRLSRTLWLTQRAVNALVWVNDQEVGAFVEAVDRANFHTVGVFALDAVLGNDKRHLAIPLARPRSLPVVVNREWL